jgi:putative aldouronate transport system permease protein
MCITLYPFLYVAALSLSEETYILAGKVMLLPKGVNSEAYRMVFEHPSFWRGYGNTIYYTVMSIVITLIMTIMCAYPLAKKALPGRSALTKMVMFTMFFGGGMIPNFLLIRYLGMYNTVWAITLPGAIGAWNVMIMRTFFENIPEALEDAAAIDGLGPIGTLIRIVLPLSKPILATMVLFVGVGQWNNWFGPLIYLSSNEKYPITLFLRNIVLGAQQLAANPKNADLLLNETAMLPAESLKAAAIMLVAMPILVLYPSVQKYFVQGMMIGAVK